MSWSLEDVPMSKLRDKLKKKPRGELREKLRRYLRGVFGVDVWRLRLI